MKVPCTEKICFSKCDSRLIRKLAAKLIKNLEERCFYRINVLLSNTRIVCIYVFLRSVRPFYDIDTPFIILQKLKFSVDNSSYLNG